MRFFRFASPGSLFFASVLFLLPWVEVRCERYWEGKLEKVDSLEASGLQLSFGGGTVRENGRVTNTVWMDSDSKKETGNWLALAYGIMICTGLILGLFCRTSARRAVLVGVSTLVALILLVSVKLAWPKIGGPPERVEALDYPKDTVPSPLLRQTAPQSSQPITPPQPSTPPPIKPLPQPPTILDGTYQQAWFTVWYWLSYVPLVLCLALCLVELYQAGVFPPPRKPASG
jgi:hypothetical protein